jgi:hypothetical protein
MEYCNQGEREITFVDGDRLTSTLHIQKQHEIPCYAYAGQMCQLLFYQRL